MRLSADTIIIPRKRMRITEKKIRILLYDTKKRPDSLGPVSKPVLLNDKTFLPVINVPKKPSPFLFLQIIQHIIRQQSLMRMMTVGRNPLPENCQ
jgi:hypothetical protein